MTPQFVVPCFSGRSDTDYRYVPWYEELDTLTHLTVITGICMAWLHDMTACQHHWFHILCDFVTTLFRRLKTVKIRDSCLIFQAVSAASRTPIKKLLCNGHVEHFFRTVPAQDFSVGPYGGVMSPTP